MPDFQMTWGKMRYAVNTGRPGLPLVFLHGTGCDSADWNEVIAMLHESVPSLTLDFRGHGKSDVPATDFTLGDLATDVAALTRHLGLERIILVGHSLGGMVALELAARSSQVAALVLLEGWTSLDAASAFNPDRFYGRLPPQAIKRIQEKNTTTQSRFAPAIWDHFWKSVQAFNAASFLARTPIPVFEVYGEMGRTKTVENSLMVPGRPNIHMLWISDAGHYLPQERPAEVASICRQSVGG